ncbi:MAG: hypothetical protein AB8D78_00775 [Akkermansiaceae bacterium]
MLDFIFENLIIFIIIAGGIAKWVEATREAKRARENPPPVENFEVESLEEFIQQAERRHPVPAVPPPLPPSTSQPMPSVEHAPVPELRRDAMESPQEMVEEKFDYELARQADLAEQLAGLKQARVARVAKPRPSDRRKRAIVHGGSIRSRLRNRSELRNAIVLKELLEKPVGLR